MAESRIRIVVEADDRASRNLRGIGDAVSNMGSQARGVGGSLRNIFEFAGGQLVADGIRNIAGSLVDLGSQALDSYATFERLTMSLETFSARELINAGVTDNMQEAIAMSGERAQELLGWIEKLAVQSPFQSGDIANAFRTAQAYGFTSDQAMRLTQATVDFAAGAGISGAMMDRITLALGQIAARGKVSSQELNQLSEAGIGARQILADAFHVSTAQMQEMIEKGLVPANVAIEAITQSLEKDFGGAAKRQANTFSGLISSLADLKEIGLRNLFAGTFKAVQPSLQRFVELVTNPAVQTSLKNWGDTIGQNIGQALNVANERIDRTVASFGLLSSQGDVVGGILAGLGQLTGGEVTINTKTKVTSVDWGNFTYTYDALSQVTSVDWFGNWFTGADGAASFVYDAAASVLSVDWTSKSGAQTAFVYDADAGIKEVHWNFDHFTYNYDATAGITAVNFAEGLYTGTYTANASVTSVLWGAFTHSYNSTSTVTNVLWGGYTHSYDAGTKISETSVLWGAYTHQYDAAAKIGESSILWGAWTTTYNATSSITSVLWGAYDHSYNSTTDITSVLWGVFYGHYEANAGITDVAWGAFRHTYQGDTQITSVLWGAYTNSYDASANVLESSVLWGAYTHQYDATSRIGESSVLWGAYTHTYDVGGKVGEANILWGAWTTTYSATSSVTSVLWGLFNHEYSVSGSITSVAWGLFNHEYSTTGAITSIAWGLFTHEYGVGGTVTNVAWGLFTHAYDSTSSVTSVLWGLFTHNYDGKASIASVLWGAWTTTYNANSSITSVLWGLFTFKYDVTSGITDVAWGDFTKIYDVTASVTDVLWGAWTKTYDVTANVTGWIVSQLPPWLGGTPVDNNAAGTNSWVGGPTWVGERGAELAQYPNGQWAWLGAKGPVILDLPAGTKIFSHEDSLKMAGGKMGAVAIGMNADGTTRPPTIWPGGGSQFADLTQAIQLGAKYLGQSGDAAGKKMAKAFESSMNKITDKLKSALSSIPGLMSPSQVSEQDMVLAQAGLYQDNVDEVLRRVKSAANNEQDKAKFAADIQAARDALGRIGITASDNIKVMAAQFEKAWTDQSLFSNKENTSLFNMDAVQRALQQQQMQAQGKNNIMELFGIPPDQVQTQALAAGVQIAAGLSQGMTIDGKTTADAIIRSAAASITAESVAPLGAALSSGIASSVAGSSNNKETKGAGTDLGSQLVGAINTSLSESTAFDTAGQTILQKIIDSWGNLSNIDVASKMANAMNVNLGTAEAIQVLQDVGEKIFKIIFQGYDAAASGADYVAPVNTGINNNKKKNAAASATSTTNVTPPTAGRSYGRAGGLMAAGAGAGGGVTVNVYANVASQLDIVDMAYQVADVLQKRGRR